MRLIFKGGLAAVLALTVPGLVFAEVSVQQENQSFTIETRAASLAEVFAALSAASGVTIRAANEFGQTVSGTFRGSQQQIISQVLSGRDYIAKHHPHAIEIVILQGPSGTSSPRVRVPSMPGVGVPTSIARQKPNSGGR